MRDRRFVAVHRGGTLTREDQVLLCEWGCRCVVHAMERLGFVPEAAVKEALETARRWAVEAATAGECRKASVRAHDFARRSTDPVAIALARAAGHAVATAHMADHSMGAAMYALKAMIAADGPLEEERRWQHAQLPESIRTLVLTGWVARGIRI